MHSSWFGTKFVVDCLFHCVLCNIGGSWISIMCTFVFFSAQEFGLVLCMCVLWMISIIVKQRLSTVVGLVGIVCSVCIVYCTDWAQGWSVGLVLCIVYCVLYWFGIVYCVLYQLSRGVVGWFGILIEI